MHDDNWIQILAFFNRFQLFNLQFINRRVFKLIDKHFSEEPYAEGMLSVWWSDPHGAFAEIGIYDHYFDKYFARHRQFKNIKPDTEAFYERQYQKEHILWRKILCRRQSPSKHEQVRNRAISYIPFKFTTIILSKFIQKFKIVKIFVFFQDF